MESSNVKKILDLFHSKDWSSFYDYQDVKNFKKNIWFNLSKAEEFNFVREVITEDLKKLNDSYEVAEFITFLIYKKGDFFAEHIDGDSYVSENRNSVLTGGYLLNDNFTGGDFIIDGNKLQAKIGDLFYFGRDTNHMVKQVESGVRYSLHFTINSSDSSINKSLV